MTSQRRRLIDALRAAVNPTQYRVSDRAAVPDQIDPKTINLRVLTKTVAPAATMMGLAYEMNVWALSPSADPATVDDDLDDALDDLLVTFLGFPFVSFRSAERGVMAAEDGGPQWHGYLFTLTAYGQIEGA